MSAERLDGPNMQPKLQESKDLRGSGYSWGRIARLRTETQYESIYQASSGDMLVVDLCSSFPQYREIMRGRHIRRMLHEAKSIAGLFVRGLTAPAKHGQLDFLDKLSEEELTDTRKAFEGKEGPNRLLLIGSILDVLINPPPPDARNPESVADIIYANFKQSNRYPIEVAEPDGNKNEKGSWIYVSVIGRGDPLKERLQSLLGDRNYRFLRDLSVYLGNQLVEEHKIREVSFLSLDCEPLDRLIKSAETAFPARMQETLFFNAGRKKERHRTANLIEELPFEPESVDLFTSVEGWPYYFRGADRRANFQIAARLGNRLKPGGKIVIFPWQMDEVDFGSKKVLDAVENLWRGERFDIEKEEVSRDQLLEEMTDRELVLAEHSPLLRHKGPFINLTLTKPLDEAT